MAHSIVIDLSPTISAGRVHPPRATRHADGGGENQTWGPSHAHTGHPEVRPARGGACGCVWGACERAIRVRRGQKLTGGRRGVERSIAACFVPSLRGRRGGGSRLASAHPRYLSFVSVPPAGVASLTIRRCSPSSSSEASKSGQTMSVLDAKRPRETVSV